MFFTTINALYQKTKLVFSLLLSLMLGSFTHSALAVDVLEGLERLSCEAIICLSTGSPPGECNPSLNYYFDIKAKKWKDTFKKRKNFLDICPSSQDGSIGSDYITLLVNGSYTSCEKDYLLSRLNTDYCTGDDFCFGPDPIYSVPKYCSELSAHEWTIEYPMPKQINPDGYCFKLEEYYDEDDIGGQCNYTFNSKCYNLVEKEFDMDGECRSFWN